MSSVVSFRRSLSDLVWWVQGGFVHCHPAWDSGRKATFSMVWPKLKGMCIKTTSWRFSLVRFFRSLSRFASWRMPVSRATCRNSGSATAVSSSGVVLELTAPHQLVVCSKHSNLMQAMDGWKGFILSSSMVSSWDEKQRRDKIGQGQNGGGTMGEEHSACGTFGMEAPQTS